MTTVMSTQSKERENRQNNNNQAYEINQSIHFHSPCFTGRQSPQNCFSPLFLAASTTRPTRLVTSSTAALAPSRVSPCFCASAEAASTTSLARVVAFSTCRPAISAACDLTV